MAYPNNQSGKADAVGLDPALHAGLLNGLVNLQQAIQALDQVSGPQTNVPILLANGWRPIMGAWAWVQSGGHLFGGYLGNVSDGDGDAVEADVFVPSAGTYTLYMNAPTDADGGIVQVLIDEVVVGVPAGYDLYSVGLAIDALVVIPALALTAGLHKLKVLVNGANVASTGFMVRLDAVELVRTA